MAAGGSDCNSVAFPLIPEDFPVSRDDIPLITGASVTDSRHDTLPGKPLHDSYRAFASIYRLFLEDFIYRSWQTTIPIPNALSSSEKNKLRCNKLEIRTTKHEGEVKTKIHNVVIKVCGKFLDQYVTKTVTNNYFYTYVDIGNELFCVNLLTPDGKYKVGETQFTGMAYQRNDELKLKVFVEDAPRCKLYVVFYFRNKKDTNSMVNVLKEHRIVEWRFFTDADGEVGCGVFYRRIFNAVTGWEYTSLENEIPCTISGKQMYIGTGSELPNYFTAMLKWVETFCLLDHNIYDQAYLKRMLYDPTNVSTRNYVSNKLYEKGELPFGSDTRDVIIRCYMRHKVRKIFKGLMEASGTFVEWDVPRALRVLIREHLQEVMEAQIMYCGVNAPKNLLRNLEFIIRQVNDKTGGKCNVVFVNIITELRSHLPAE